MGRRNFGYPPGTRRNYKRGESIVGSFLGAGLKIAKGTRRKRSTSSTFSSMSFSTSTSDTSNEWPEITRKGMIWMAIVGIIFLILSGIAYYYREYFLSVDVSALAMFCFFRPLYSVRTKNYIVKAIMYLISQIIALGPILFPIIRVKYIWGIDRDISKILDDTYWFPSLAYIYAALPFFMMLVLCITAIGERQPKE